MRRIAPVILSWMLPFSMLVVPSESSMASKHGQSNDLISVVPLIDIGAWTARLSDEEVNKSTLVERKAIADAVGRACKDIGFFAIQNHGVNETVIEQLWQSAREFFDLPVDQKLKSKTLNESEYPYGYEQSETLVVGKALDQESNDIKCHSNSNLPAPDLKETFSIGPSNPKAGMPPRQYPESPKEAREALAAYYREMEDLALVLMRIFATALDLPEDWFESKMGHHLSALRILNYFEVSPTADRQPGQLRAGAHTDYGALTILKSGGRGLQVKASSGDWVDVSNLPNTFVINLGDLMQRWTNGKCASTTAHAFCLQLSP